MPATAQENRCAEPLRLRSPQRSRHHPSRGARSHLRRSTNLWHV